jgi:superkiller protein 3
VPATVKAAIEEMRCVAQRVLTDFPNTPDALEMSARLYLTFGQSAKAAEYWERCLALAPDYSYAYRGLATIATNKGDLPEAVRLLRKALATAPDSFEAQFELAKSLFDESRIQESLEVLQKHLRAHPRSARGYTLLGAVYLQSNAPEKARQAYQSAIEIDPNDEYPYLGLATACATLGRAEESKQCRQKFRQLRAGTFKASQGRLSDYDDVAGLCYELAKACTNAGRLYMARGNFAEVERLCRRAVQVAPRHVESRQALAWLYRRNGRTPEAIHMLEQLARLEPSAAEYPLEIERLYRKLGQQSRAEEWLRRAREIQAKR